MRLRRAGSGGFGLVEVMVALVIGGAVLLGARAMLEHLADAADHVVESAAEVDRQANAERLLRALAGRLDEAPEVLSGDAGTLRFWTWCEVPAGWLERCEATLGFVPVGGSHTLALTLSTGSTFVLRTDFETGALRYLSAPDHGGAWLDRWRSSVTSPLAIGIVLDADTMIVRIGERG